MNLRHLALSLLLAVAALAADLKIGSLNCYLLFNPAVDHRGKVDDANRMTADQYRQKLSNLASLTKGYNPNRQRKIVSEDQELREVPGPVAIHLQNAVHGIAAMCVQPRIDSITFSGLHPTRLCPHPPIIDSPHEVTSLR